MTLLRKEFYYINRHLITDEQELKLLEFLIDNKITYDHFEDVSMVDDIRKVKGIGNV